MSRRRLRDRPRGGRSCNHLDLVAYSGSRDSGIAKTVTIHVSFVRVCADRINAEGTPSPLEPFLRGQGPAEFPGASEAEAIPHP
jgi:hypothetical protein